MDKELVTQIVGRYDGDQGMLIPMMQDLQAEYGYLPAEQLREEACPAGPVPQADSGSCIPADLLGVIACQNTGARRPAPAGGVELGEAHAPPGECVQVGRPNLAAVAAGIGEAHVVGHDQQHIRRGPRALPRPSRAQAFGSPRRK